MPTFFYLANVVAHLAALRSVYFVVAGDAMHGFVEALHGVICQGATAALPFLSLTLRDCLAGAGWQGKEGEREGYALSWGGGGSRRTCARVSGSAAVTFLLFAVPCFFFPGFEDPGRLAVAVDFGGGAGESEVGAGYPREMGASSAATPLPAGLAVIDALTISYDVEWPASMLVTPDILRQYNTGMPMGLLRCRAGLMRGETSPGKDNLFCLLLLLIFFFSL